MHCLASPSSQHTFLPTPNIKVVELHDTAAAVSSLIQMDLNHFENAESIHEPDLPIFGRPVFGLFLYLCFFVIENQDVRAKGTLEKVEQCWTGFWTNCHLIFTMDSVVAKFIALNKLSSLLFTKN